MSTYLVYIDGDETPIHHFLENDNATPEEVIASLEAQSWFKVSRIENTANGLAWRLSEDGSWTRTMEPYQPLPGETRLFP